MGMYVVRLRLCVFEKLGRREVGAFGASRRSQCLSLLFLRWDGRNDAGTRLGWAIHTRTSIGSMCLA